ncbi:MAG: acyl-(acyl-carrier-protein)--UDP-N-acetylglucosamine O-acyltransferase [Verrucomicrobiales bacterium]|nr:acyl-(acyl-carrier-protein)--UDP-N-acetylglucosamine O-acyltransferase [Verrucomicrobiales bacterium]
MLPCVNWAISIPDMIHSTAVIHPKARLDATVAVGPLAVIDEHVVLGPGCVVGPHAYLTGHTTIGANNKIFAGAVIGEAPQDLKYKNAPTRLRIGNNNTFREGVTVHRSNKDEEDTVIGSDNFLMANAHVGHNSQVGNNIIIANGALLGGHVRVDDRAFISGNCLVHQFARVGSLSLMQGGAAISKDLPPFTIALGVNGICGLNIIGLRRAGLSPEERLELKKVYHELFRSGQNITKVAAACKSMFTSKPAALLIDFVLSSKRGVAPHFVSIETDDDDET